MARILITGASGLLGINLAQETMNAHDIVAVDRGKLINAPFKILNGDLLNPGILDSVLDSAQPEWLINCAALADLEACEESPALPAASTLTCPRKWQRLAKNAVSPSFTSQPMQSSTAKKTVSILKRMLPIRLVFIRVQN